MTEDRPSTAEKENTVAAPTPERQIIHELCLLLDLVHNGGEGAIEAAPQWLRRRYEWALQQAQDAGRVQ